MTTPSAKPPPPAKPAPLSVPLLRPTADLKDELPPKPDLKDEWKECRQTIDRFDKLLVDLRKTGFGLVTALVGAASFIFKDSLPGIRGPILCMVVVLIVTLYAIDRVHQVWLRITVARACNLEEALGFALTTKISDQFKGRDATIIGLILYFILLAASCAVFWYSIPQDEGITGGHRMVIIVAGIVGFASMIAAGWWTRKQNPA